MAELFALLASLGYASSYILARKGLKGSDPFAGVLISILAGSTVLLTVALFRVPAKHLVLSGILIFALAGVCAPGLGRLFSFVALQKIGVSRAALIYATEPLLTVVAARFFLGEALTLQILLGTILIILGVMNLSREDRDQRPWRPRDLIFPALATVFYGASSVIRKAALDVLPDPLLGATVNSLAASALLVGFTSLRGGRGHFKMKKTAAYFYAASGIAAATAILFAYIALDHGEVVVVSPLMSTRPLFAILLSFLFLRDIEKLGWRVVAGGMLVVLGSAAITMR